jgi:hypothetical protein
MKVWVFYCADYEDRYMVGPFKTKALAEQAREARAATSTWSLDEPSSSVFALTVKGVRATKTLIAQYEDDARRDAV